MLIGQLAPSEERFLVWEKRLDQIVGIQNDLTNHSRFEKLPSDSDIELCEVPPSEVIYASVQCLYKTWPLFLEECGINESYRKNIQLTEASVRARLDAYQSSVYKKSFKDENQCRNALHHVFEAHKYIAVKIHATLDNVKRYIAIQIANDQVPSILVLHTCTEQIIQALDDLAKGLIDSI